jgi:hypothetical protein
MGRSSARRQAIWWGAAMPMVDGALSPAEFEQVDWARLSADLNRDGRIGREEFYFSRNQLFLAADRDGDRRLGQREIDPIRFPVFRF